MAHILAVDDEPDVSALVRTALERDGHTVRTCAAGGEVTEALCRWADCILLDIMMPGEDGVALCLALGHGRLCPFPSLSACAWNTSRRR